MNNSKPSRTGAPAQVDIDEQVPGQNVPGRSGFETGWRMSMFFTLFRVSESLGMDLRTLCEQLNIEMPDLTSEALAQRVGVEPSYVRKQLRSMTDRGLVNVVKLPQWGTPPTRAYTIDIEATAAPRRRA